MRVVIAPGSFGPHCGAPEAAAAFATGWARHAPEDEVHAIGMTDGAAGFVATLAAGLGLETTPVVVHDPLGRPTPAELLVRDTERGLTAYLESAQAAGRHLIDDRTLAAPDMLSSAGVGELMIAAREAGATRIVVGVGPLASHDGGLGLLGALGAGEYLEHLSLVREDWSDVTVLLAHADDLPLLGFHGASAALGTDFGVSAEVTQRLESQLGQLTERVNVVLPPTRDLLSGQLRRAEREPGSGAGGGVGYGLLTLGAFSVAGARFALEELDLPAAIPGALVVTGCATYDWRTVHEGVVAEVARQALASASPTVVLAQEVAVGRREGMSLGIAATYAARAGEELDDLAERVARTWSPRR